MPSLLVVDDDPLIHLRFQRDFEGQDLTIQLAKTAEEGLRKLREHAADTVVLDVMLPDMSGLEAFHEVKKLDSHVPVIFITASEESSTAIEAMKLGAFDYLTKPLDRNAVRSLVARAIETRRMASTPVEMDATPSVPQRDTLVGRCPAMQEVYKAIGRVASQDLTVLITGESGTGKELVARAIFQHSQRSQQKFLAINCAAIPDSLLESELFGHEKGAFTGADQQRIGKFEQCTGGTLFMDEIGDMTPPTQSKVLRALQDQQFERVGGNETIQTDVRLIAATNRNLPQLVEQGLFRQDLYYRLVDFTIHLPPLRERRPDVPLLAEYFLKRFNPDLGKSVTDISPAAMNVLTGYEWPGNIREFQSVLKQALLNATGPVLAVEDLPESVRRADAALPEHSAGTFNEIGWGAFVDQRIAAGSQQIYQDAQRQMERQIIAHVLRHTAGNQARAARLLGITRTTLRNKLRELGISINHNIRAE